MDPDEDQTLDENEDLGGGEETTDTGQPPAGGEGQVPPTPATPPQPVERQFTQAQVNAFLADERRKWEARQRATPPAARPPAAETPGKRQFDAETAAALQDFLAPHIAPLKQQAVANEIDRATNAIKAKYPELTQKGADGNANIDAVINLVLQWDERIVNTAPMDWLLEQGYRTWKFGNYNEEQVRDKIISDYREGKIKVSRATPTPQGSGGRAPLTPPQKKKSKPGDFSDADSAMRALVAESEASA